MQRSADRILTTHAGSLPRPAELDVAFEQRTADEAGYAKILEQAVDDVVKTSRRSFPEHACPFASARVALLTLPDARYTRKPLPTFPAAFLIWKVLSRGGEV